MKRRLLWLALPMVLLLLVLGAKWRINHPTPTKDDSEIRALLLRASTVVVTEGFVMGGEETYGTLALDEVAPFVNSFHTLPYGSIKRNFATKVRGILQVKFQFDEPEEHYTKSIDVRINSGSQASYVHRENPLRQPILSLHPVTSKVWMELLLAHPRIGPQLKRRMNQ